MPKRFCIVAIFSIAFAYIEAAVVVYIRAIFYPAGFTFPLAEFGADVRWQRFLLTEAGREAATIVLILTSAWLFGRDRRRRLAYFLTIFAIWDIFYYIWLKVLIDWPSSIMDWDILFLIPLPWASPVLAPVLVSMIMLFFAVMILYRPAALRVNKTDWLGFILAAFVVVLSFCIAGMHITEPDFQTHFYWPLFALGCILALVLFVKCLYKPKTL